MFNDRDLEKLKSVLQAKSQEAVDQRDRIIREVTKEAAEDMHRRVDRIDTERMKGSVSFITTPTRGKFGWYIGDSITKDQPVKDRNDPAANEYFVYQEHGFKNSRTGAIVAPMHALMGAFVQARDNLKNEVERLAK